MLNPQKGNMYPWVTHTWNAIKGKCSHNCKYCYMKQYPQNDIHLDKEEFKTDFGIGKVIFVGSSCDMFAGNVPYNWITNVLNHCSSYKENIYYFQSKCPSSFLPCLDEFLFPTNTNLGTTIETNLTNKNICTGPDPIIRYLSMLRLTKPKFVSIEPIMDFTLDIMLRWINDINPEFVSIGADSKGHNLPEPLPEKINDLITGLKEFTDVELKSNLKRLYNK